MGHRLTGAPTWKLGAIADDIFSDGTAYHFILDATDKLGNLTEVKSSMPYLSVPPVAPASLTVSQGVGRLELSWSAVTNAAGYVVVRQQGSAVGTGPTQGKSYTSGATLSSSETVAYAGTGLTLTDGGLAGDQTYYYAVYAYDLAYNYSPAVTGSETVRAGFTGLTQAFVAGPSRLVGASWQLVNDGVDAVNSYLYNMFPSDTSGGEAFSSPAAAFTGGATFGAFTAVGSASVTYVVGRSQDPSANASTNTAEKSLNLASGYHHRILGLRTFNGEPSNTAYTYEPLGIAVDPWGNQIFSANNQIVYVRCHETGNAPYCRGRSVDSIYTLFGSDAVGDAADNSPPFAAVGSIFGVAVDQFGNVYAADQTYYRIRVQCNNTGSAAGFCAGKTDGNVYRMIGNGAPGATTAGAAASASAIGVVQAVAVDAYGNVFYGDENSVLVMAICYAASGPFCSGKTVGDVYTVAGNGFGGDGNTGVATATTIGSPYALALDAYGNVFFDDYYHRVRAVCLTTSGPFCAGMIVGNIYRVAGDGTTNDGASGGVAASTAIGGTTGLALDANGNIFVGDSTNNRVRGICLNVSAAGFCSGLTAGDVYNVAGNGSQTDDPYGVATDQGMGWPMFLATDAFGNIFIADGGFAHVRMVCENTQGGDCVGKVAGDIYPMIGSGGAMSSTASVKPALYSFANGPSGIATDSAGNLYYADTYVDRVFALCTNVTTTGTFCAGKTAGYRYRMTGTGENLDTSATNVPFANQSIGDMAGGVAVDPYNNVYFADTYGDSRIRALCVNASGGFCSGKTVGNMYTVAGNGTVTGGAADNSVAATSTQGLAQGLTADSFGNLFWYDAASYRIYVVCNVTTASSTNVCNGKTAGNLYRVAGSGSLADGASGTAAIGAGLGQVYSMAVDAANNLFVVDNNYYRVRAICLNTTSGYCLGQTAADIYRVAGTGSQGDGANATAFASATFYAFTGSAFDKYGNLFLADMSPRLRVLCFNVAANHGYCSGKSANTVYNFVGGGVANSGDAGSNLPIAGLLIDAPYSPSGQTLVVNQATNDVFYSDANNYSIRMFTGY